MLVRSLGLAFVLALTALACGEDEAPPTDESTGAAEKGAKAPAPAADKPASSTEGTSAPAAAADTPATNKAGDKATPADKATPPGTGANKPAGTPAPKEKADPATALATLQACVTSCGQDKACVQTCITDAAAGAGLPALPGGGG